MSNTTIKEAKYIYVDTEQNNNKFWNITLDSNNTVTSHWGRVGEPGKSKSFPQSSDYSALSDYEKRIRTKEREGYTKCRTLSGSTGSSIINTNLESVAKSQISTNSPELSNLISYLAKRNIHSILSSTSLSYNDTTGLFSTPLGLVTSDAISEARFLLNDIADLVKDQDYFNVKFTSLLNNYLRIIPQNIGRRRPEPQLLYPNLTAVQNQNNILDSLETSLEVALTRTNDMDEPQMDKIFDVKLNVENDLNVIERIRQGHHKTRQRMHATYDLDVKKVYNIEIGKMKQNFEERGKLLGNVMELYHGSRSSNILSIFHKGLILPPKNASHLTGALFGPYVYFANQSTKSLNYSFGAWDIHAKDSNCFLFVADVAMGNYIVPRYGQQSIPIGHDSFWARPSSSGIQNDELIVRDPSQANLKYLVEFSPYGR